METLQRLTRRQLIALQRVGALATPERGVALKRLARELRVRPPTALAHLTALEALGLVDRSRGKTQLSRRGTATLREYVRHHRVAETLFSEAGLSADDACEAAREVDLAISHQMVAKVCRVERHPARCPHGAPIDPCDRPSPLGADRG